MFCWPLTRDQFKRFTVFLSQPPAHHLPPQGQMPRTRTPTHRTHSPPLKKSLTVHFILPFSQSGGSPYSHLTMDNANLTQKSKGPSRDKRKREFRRGESVCKERSFPWTIRQPSSTASLPQTNSDSFIFKTACPFNLRFVCFYQEGTQKVE